MKISKDIFFKSASPMGFEHQLAPLTPVASTNLDVCYFFSIYKSCIRIIKQKIILVSEDKSLDGAHLSSDSN